MKEIFFTTSMVIGSLFFLATIVIPAIVFTMTSWKNKKIADEIK